MKILILDKNIDYSKRFKHYLEKKYPQLQIVAFDDIEAINSYFQNDSCDVVLFDADFENINIERFSEKFAFAYISKTREIVNDTETIFKYSKVSEIYSMICQVYEQKKKRVVKTEIVKTNKKTDVITFLPVHGGAGGSTMAASCAISLADQAETLYINIEQKASDFVFFEGDNKKSFTDIVTAMKTKYDVESIKLVLKQVIQNDKRQGRSNLSYIKGYNNIMDCISIQPAHIEFVLRVLREHFSYRYIIIDTDFIVNDMLKKIISISDKLVFVSSDSDISNMKLTKIHRYLEVMGRESDARIPSSYIIFNQHYGTNDENFDLKDMKVILTVPAYIASERISSQAIINQVVANGNAFMPLIDG